VGSTSLGDLVVGMFSKDDCSIESCDGPGLDIVDSVAS